MVASLWTLFEIHRQQFGTITTRGLSTAGAVAERQMDDYLAAVTEGVSAPHSREMARMPWLEFALNPFPDLFVSPPGGASVKVKDALLKQRFTDGQIRVAYDYLTRTDYDAIGGMLGMATYGGRINTVAADATASAQRDSILDIACSTGWIDPGDEEKNLKWYERSIGISLQTAAESRCRARHMTAHSSIIRTSTLPIRR